MNGPPSLDPGLWCVLATPFSPALAVDEESPARQVRLSTSAGATGLVALGVFGEAAALDATEQRRVVETVTGAAPEVPVVVGISALTTAVALEQASSVVAAAGPQLAGLMVQANSADTENLVRHLTAVHASTGAGVVLQDYPLVSGVRVSTAQILTCSTPARSSSPSRPRHHRPRRRSPA